MTDLNKALTTWHKGHPPKVGFWNVRSTPTDDIGKWWSWFDGVKFHWFSLIGHIPPTAKADETGIPQCDIEWCYLGNQGAMPLVSEDPKYIALAKRFAVSHFLVDVPYGYTWESLYDALESSSVSQAGALFSMVVLATSGYEGTVVHTTPKCPHRLGWYSACWIPFEYEKEWERLETGTEVTLTA